MDKAWRKWQSFALSLESAAKFLPLWKSFTLASYLSTGCLKKKQMKIAADLCFMSSKCLHRTNCGNVLLLKWSERPSHTQVQEWEQRSVKDIKAWRLSIPLKSLSLSCKQYYDQKFPESLLKVWLLTCGLYMPRIYPLGKYKLFVLFMYSTDSFMRNDFAVRNSFYEKSFQGPGYGL